MHQTFYIDIDEEITSIVERLRKTETPEAVIVVPKRALLIQSIVNLKLLRKEADNLGLKISIVTQDKLGKMLIKKAGISIQQKLEDDLSELDVADNAPQREVEREIETTELGEVNSRSQRNLEKIGSANYFVSNDAGNDPIDNLNGWEKLVEMKDREVSSGARMDSGQRINVSDGMMASDDIRNIASGAMDVSLSARGPVRNVSRNNMSGSVPNSLAKRNDISAPGARIAIGGSRSLAPKKEESWVKSVPYNDASKPARNTGISTGLGRKSSVVPALVPTGDSGKISYGKSGQSYEQGRNHRYDSGQRDFPRDEQLEKFFYANTFSNKSREGYDNKKQETVRKTGGVFFKLITILGAVVLVLGLAYEGYLYVPKAVITVFAKKEVKSADIEITGDVNHSDIDYDKSIIPAKLMEFDEEVAKTFDATGGRNVSNQKAGGKITIYNEFSSSPQPLVATTRFLSDDQKMFRLVQGVTIPGTTNVGGEIKPGVVEAEIVADEAGDAYNIDPTNFTIPGFKSSGNDKYTKIYAKSEARMSGGGNGNNTIKVVADKDISDAKDKMSLEINSAIKAKVKDQAAGTVILDDAIIVDEPVYRVSNSAGETADNFEIKVQAHARALVFSENDVKKIANSVIAKLGGGKVNIDSGSLIIDYGKASVDFKAGTIDIKMHASSVMQPNIDLENLKKGILGKNNDELAEYLKTYPNIEKAEVEYFPQLFISKIPMNEKRVDVIINATMP